MNPSAAFDGPMQASTQEKEVASARNGFADRLFIHAGLLGAIVLQRFCIHVGGGAFYFAQFIFIAALAGMLLVGRATLRPVISLLFAAFAALALVSTFVALNFPDPRITISIGSMLVVLLLYVALVVRPTAGFDGTRTFTIFVGYVRLCAVLGIIQYLVQFAGIRLFSFSSLMPALKPFLVEEMFNHQPYVSYGSSIMRSNGFFLIEPSVFSQLLVLAVLVDVFIRRSWWALPLYVVAHLLSYSGTGLLALAVTLPILALADIRSSGRILILVAGLIVVGIVGAIALPDQFAAITGRANELNYAGSSGYARYVAPFEVMGAVWGETRTLIGYGPGAMERATFFLAGSGNALMKLFIDYGLFGMISFVTFLVAAVWRRDLAIISIYGLVNFQLGGGFLLFPPFVVIMAILCIWSSPADAARAGREVSDDAFDARPAA
jgi:hypothetical protein